ncbi:MAG: CpcD/allophycocyanin linker domain-containing protein [Prochlorococcaceae cyanobacterium]
MKVSAGTRGTGLNSDRQVTLTVTGMNNNDYSRTAEMVMNVPFTRMRETMRLVQCMGGRITDVSVSGSGEEALKAVSKGNRRKAAKA